MSEALRYWVRKVGAMQPGQRLEVARRDLSDIPSFEHNYATFTPADRILGNIIGSAYTHSFTVRPDTGNVVFERHVDTGKRHYHEPDDEYRLKVMKRRAEAVSVRDAVQSEADDAASN